MSLRKQKTETNENHYFAYMARGKNPTVNRACGPGTAGREEGRALKGQGAWLRAPQQGELQRLKGLWGV